jgi:hypothetical protein
VETVEIELAAHRVRRRNQSPIESRKGIFSAETALIRELGAQKTSRSSLQPVLPTLSSAREPMSNVGRASRFTSKTTCAGKAGCHQEGLQRGPQKELRGYCAGERSIEACMKDHFADGERGMQGDDFASGRQKLVQEIL